MVPFIVLLAVTSTVRLLGAIGVGDLNDWDLSVRVGLAAMLLVAASAHFSRRRTELVAMVPRLLPAPHLLVTATGVLEIAVAIGLLISATASSAAVILVVLLVAMFPANVQASRNALTLGSKPTTSLPVRAAIQAAFLGAALVAF